MQNINNNWNINYPIREFKRTIITVGSWCRRRKSGWTLLSKLGCNKLRGHFYRKYAHVRFQSQSTIAIFARQEGNSYQGVCRLDRGWCSHQHRHTSPPPSASQIDDPMLWTTQTSQPFCFLLFINRSHRVSLGESPVSIINKEHIRTVVNPPSS